MVFDPTRPEVKVTETTEVVSKRERHPAHAEKAEIVKSFMDVIADEDVDAFFLATFNLAQELGYKLQADPVILLQQVNNRHK